MKELENIIYRFLFKDNHSKECIKKFGKYKEFYSYFEIRHEILYHACLYGYADLVEYVYKNITFTPLRNKNNTINYCLINATRGGHLDIIKFFLLQYNIGIWKDVLIEEAIKFNLKLFNFWFDYIGNYKYKESFIWYAVESGNFDTFNYFRKQLYDNEIPKSNWILSNAVIGGNRKIIDFLLDSYDYNVWYGSYAAAITGDIELLNFFIEKGAGFSIQALNNSSSRGHLEIVKVILSKIKYNAMDVHVQLAMTNAVEGDQLHILEYLSKLNTEIDWIDLFKRSAEYNRLIISKYCIRKGNITEKDDLIIGLNASKMYESIDVYKFLMKKMYNITDIDLNEFYKEEE